MIEKIKDVVLKHPIGVSFILFAITELIVIYRHKFWLGLILLIVYLAVVLLTACIEALIDARNDVNAAKTEPMFWCNKHGYFRQKHCLTLFPELHGRPENSHVCPECYYEMVWEEPNKKLRVV